MCICALFVYVHACVHVVIMCILDSVDNAKGPDILTLTRIP